LGILFIIILLPTQQIDVSMHKAMLHSLHSQLPAQATV